MYGDGGGLWLCVTSKNAASWLFRYSLDGKAREMGLGPFRDVTIADARERATAARRLRAAGIDPITERDRMAAAARLEAARAITFKEASQQYIAAHKAGWKNDKHAAQWPSTLERFAYPIIGNLPVGAVDVGLVVKTLQPIWSQKPETAGRLRGRIEAILDWATVRGYRQGENPARWRGHLENLFPRKSKVRRVKHHPALPFADLPKFMAKLAAQPGVSARALRFTILTAARTGEVIDAQKPEVNAEQAIWTVPAKRMKGGREHRVPLAREALALLGNDLEGEGHLFTSIKTRKGLSNMAMLETLRRMGRDDLTVHGFRSTFRDWASETTNFPNEVIEMALAHVIEDKTEAAYRRGDLFEKRKKLMNAWVKYCMSAQS